MAGTIAKAYQDNKQLQDALEEKLPTEALILPVPSWFWTLRAATTSLGDPVIHNAVCLALAQHTRMVVKKRKAKEDAAAELQAQKESVQQELESAKQSFEDNFRKRVATADVEERVLNAEAHEQIWRKRAQEKTDLAVTSEKRVHMLNTAYKEGVEKIEKDVEALGKRIKKLEKKPEDGEIEKAKNDVSEMKKKTAKSEEKRGLLLKDQLRCLMEDHEMLQGGLESLEAALRASQREAQLLKEKYNRAWEKKEARKAAMALAQLGAADVSMVDAMESEDVSFAGQGTKRAVKEEAEDESVAKKSKW